MTLAMQEEIVDAEIVLSKIEALQLVEDIRQLANNYVATRDALLAKLEYARDTNAHEQIEGCKSYGDFIAHVFSGIPIKWSREDRRVLVADMAFHEKGGMSTRQIGQALGTSFKTAARDIASVSNDTDEPRRVSSSDGKTRTYTTTPQPEPDETLNVDKTTGEIKAATEVAPTAHQSPFAAGETIKDFGNGTVITAGYSGLAESTAESVTAALNWYRANPTSGTEECEAATGVSERVAERSRAALIGNKEIPDPKPNRLVERFDKIAHGLTYIADDLEKHLEDLDRAEPEDLEYGREFFEDAMTKLNHFRRKLNTKFA